MTRAPIYLAIAAIFGCDSRQTFMEPHPSLERMLDQPKVDPYETVMRAPPEGAVAQERDESAHAPWTRATLMAGRDHYDTFCAVCHGLAGDGDGPLATKLAARRPRSLHDDEVRALPAERVEQIVARGYGYMPSYRTQLNAEERWAVVGYVKALELRRRAPVAALPEGARARLP